MTTARASAEERDERVKYDAPEKLRHAPVSFDVEIQCCAWLTNDQSEDCLESERMLSRIGEAASKS
jgi:hypothetical protein